MAYIPPYGGIPWLSPSPKAQGASDLAMGLALATAGMGGGRENPPFVAEN